MSSCRARGLSTRTDEHYGYALHSMFLARCATEHVTRLEELDRRTLDPHTAFLLHKRTRSDLPSTAHAGHSCCQGQFQLLMMSVAARSIIYAIPRRVHQFLLLPNISLIR